MNRVFILNANFLAHLDPHNSSLIRILSGLPRWLNSKEIACNAGNAGSIPESERPRRGGHGNPLQYSCWRIPRTEEPGRLQFMGLQESDMTEHLNHHGESSTFSWLGEKISLSPDLYHVYFKGNNLHFGRQTGYEQLSGPFEHQ